MKNAIILCSGGLDSVTTAYYVKNKLNYRNIKIVFFDYSQRTLGMERKFSGNCAKNLKADFKEISLNQVGRISNPIINKRRSAKKVMLSDIKDTSKESINFYVPCRNIIFLAYAMALAESLFVKEKKTYDIFIGFKCEGKESYPDTTKTFVDEINKLVKVSCYGRFKVKAPLLRMDKDEIILLGKKLNINFKNTYSCYIGDKKHCGYCLACRLRQEAFYWANLDDPTQYDVRMPDFRKSSDV